MVEENCKDSGQDHEVSIVSILEFLDREKQRCTYGAIGELLGVLPVAVGRILGPRQKKTSWVVNKKTRMPIGYCEREIHSDLESNPYVISDGTELRRVMDDNQPIRDGRLTGKP